MGISLFLFATTLAEFATEDDFYGRAGAPLQNPDGKPLYKCSVEQMPFKDKEFDFVYCSHVLEHVVDPIRACRELMRVARRGYIETPTPERISGLIQHGSQITYGRLNMLVSASGLGSIPRRR